MQYLMHSSDDCGPAAISAVTGTPYDQIISRWPGGWRGGDRGRLGMPNDTPYDHFALLRDLGAPWRIVTCCEILAGQAAPEKTVILLHHPQHPWLKQHWCILRGVTPTHVDLWWGLPEQQTASPTREQFATTPPGGLRARIRSASARRAFRGGSGWWPIRPGNSSDRGGAP